MRILVFASSYGHIVGGGPVLAPLLMAALAARGHQIVVITDRWPDSLPEDETHAGVRVVRIPVRIALGGDFALFALVRRRVAALKRALMPDLIYVFSSGRCEVFHYLTEADGAAPLVVTLHDLFPPERYHGESIVGRNLRAAAWVTGCSRAVIDWAVRHVPEIEKRASPIPNAVPAPAPGVATARVDRRRLLFPGRLVGKKGCDLALAAVRELSARYPDLVLDIAGDGPERAVLHKMAAHLDIAGRTRFRGAMAREALMMLMAEAHVVLVPSRDEPFGLVALEAAHTGRPVVAAAAGGLPEVVRHGISGVVVPVDDAGALAEAVASLLDDPEYADRLGMAAREIAGRDFCWSDFVDAYDTLFQRMATA